MYLLLNTLQETSLGAELRNIKGQALMNGNKSRKTTTHKQFLDSQSLSDSKTSTQASTSLSMDDFGAVDSVGIMPSTSKPAEVRLYKKKSVIFHLFHSFLFKKIITCWTKNYKDGVFFCSKYNGVVGRKFQ